MHHIWILVGTWTQNEKSSSLMSCVCPKMVDKTIFIKDEMRWEAVVASFPLCPTSLTSHAIDFAVLYELWIWLYLFNVPMAVFFFHCQCHWQMPSLLFHIMTNSWSTAICRVYLLSVFSHWVSSDGPPTHAHALLYIQMASLFRIEL